MVLNIGHRGAMGHKPENTLKSFERAIELSADMIELDIRLCGTEEPVIIHDPKIDRTTDGEGYVREISLEELKKLDAGEGEKVPTLKESLNLIDGRVKVALELKGRETTQTVAEVIKRYIEKKEWTNRDFLVTSFNHHRLGKMNSLVPNVETGALIVGLPLNFAEFGEKANAQFILPHKEFVSEEFVKDAHDRGIRVVTWTVNDSREIERMKSLGVDGIVTDYPNRV